MNDFLNELKLARYPLYCNHIFIENMLSLVHTQRPFKSTKALSKSFKSKFHSFSPLPSHLLILNEASLRSKWKMVEQTVQKELNLANETLETKRNFGEGFGRAPPPAKKRVDNMAINITTPNDNMIMKPNVPLPN